MKKLLVALSFLANSFTGSGQTITDFADSIRVRYKIPELAFAVVSSDTIFEMRTAGVQRIHTDFQAKPDDRFHIGSNTKAITSFIAALLVAQGQIDWKTKFLDLFPGFESKSRREYRNVTLQDLLTFRGTLPAYTYTFDKPARTQITGNDAEQRRKLARYFLSQKPMRPENGLTPSNAGYILAGLMLEKATGKSFKELVAGFGKTQGIAFGFDYPNLTDTTQPWGHDGHLHPLPPSDDYKLNWLLPAGNVNVRLADYIKFIQLQLKGLKGQTAMLSSQTFDELLYGLPTFSFGWFNKFDAATNHHLAYNEGNAGAFITYVEVIKEADRAYIVFTNSASEATRQGIQMIINRLQTNYGR